MYTVAGYASLSIEPLLPMRALIRNFDSVASLIDKLLRQANRQPLHPPTPHTKDTMGPDRTHPSRNHGHGNGNRNAKAGPSTAGTSTGGTGGRKQLSMEQRDPAGIPGVSKLKASIRQTRRFLAKVCTESQYTHADLTRCGVVGIIMVEDWS